MPSSSRRWPEPDAPGTYNIHCSCLRWSFTGSAREILLEARRHDDSPRNKHVVVIAPPYASDYIERRRGDR